MHYHIILSALAALASATPVPVPEIIAEAPTGVTLEHSAPVPRAVANNCEKSSFVNQLSGGSPLIEDCRALARSIADEQEWNLSCWKGDEEKTGRGAWDTIVHHGSCAFGAQCQKAGPWTVKIGNQDIIDLINSSVDRFGYAGQVGSEGAVDCENKYMPQTDTIRWGVFHS